MNRFLFLFQSTHSVIKAEKVCLNAGISCSVIAIPRDISSECGMALEVAGDQREQAAELLAKHKILFSIA